MVVSTVNGQPRSGKRILLGLVAVCVGLLIAECMARVFVWVAHGPRMYRYDPELGFSMWPNLDIWVKSLPHLKAIHIRTDGLGNRITPPPREPARAETIVLVGDSFAFGEGVEEDETVAAHLSSHGFHVVNLGVNAYGTHQEMLSYRRYADSHRGHFDWVAVLVYSNDAEDVRASVTRLRSRPTALWDGRRLNLEPFQPSLADRLIDYSDLFAVYRRYTEGPVILPGDGYETVAACLAEIRRDASAASVRALMLFHDALEPGQAKRYLDAAGRHGVQLVDLSPMLNRWGQKIIADDGVHWNGQGAALVAKEIVRQIEVSRAGRPPQPPRSPPLS